MNGHADEKLRQMYTLNQLATLRYQNRAYFTIPELTSEFYKHAIKIHTRQPFEAKQNKSSNKNVDNYS